MVEVEANLILGSPLPKTSSSFASWFFWKLEDGMECWDGMEGWPQDYHMVPWYSEYCCMYCNSNGTIVVLEYRTRRSPQTINQFVTGFLGQCQATGTRVPRWKANVVVRLFSLFDTR
jgi:hypothetical protein